MVENSLYNTTATAAAVDVLGYSCRRVAPQAPAVRAGARLAASRAGSQPGAAQQADRYRVAQALALADLGAFTTRSLNLQPWRFAWGASAVARRAGSQSPRAPRRSGPTWPMAWTWSQRTTGGGRSACTARRGGLGSCWSMSTLTPPSSPCTGSRRQCARPLCSPALYSGCSVCRANWSLQTLRSAAHLRAVRHNN